jgi:hypothetical protein
MTNRTDDFNRADSGATIDSPSDGLGNYTVAQTWGIQSNRGYCANGGSLGAAVLEASADVEVQVTIAVNGGAGGGGHGVVFRYVDANNYWFVRARVDASVLNMQKFVGGSGTDVGTDFSYTPANGDVIKVVAEGTSISVYLNGTLRIGPVTESTHLTATKHGLFAHGDSTARFDDLSITEVGAEEAQLLSPIQDISAGTWLPSSGSPAELWEMIDGEQSPDSDYCYTTSAGTMEVKFAPGSTPSLQSGHTLSYRLRGNGTCDALVKLKVGSTVLAQWTETNVPAVDTDYEHTLDSSPSFTISDYTDLRISVEAVP